MAITSEFIRANGLRFHLLTCGPADGPLVLLLHGFPEFSYSWISQLEALGAAGYRAVAPDLRGYNLTDKPRGLGNYRDDALTLDVQELLRALGGERAVIMGHDWGGIIAWWFAMDYSEHVDRLVVMNAPHPALWRRGMLMPRQWLRSAYIAAFQTPWLPETLFRLNPWSLALGIRATSVNRLVFDSATLREYARAIAQPGAMHAALNYYRALVRWGFWRAVKPIDVPTLLIWGEQDIALDRRLTYGTEQYVSDFRIRYIPSSGHWVQREAAVEVNQAVLDFLGPPSSVRVRRPRRSRS